MIILYVKTHNKTGLKYFGKTCKDPFKYRGSGKYWKRHLRIHGNDVSTEIVAVFDNEAEAEIFAIQFSLENDIVESIGWANLMIENAKDGAPQGHKGHVFYTDELQLMSNLLVKRWADADYKEKMRKIQSETYSKGRKVVLPLWTEERKKLQSEIARKVSEKRLEDFLEFVRAPRTEKHKHSISKALTGKSKSKLHRFNLAWNKLTSKNPNLLERFVDYSSFVMYIVQMVEEGRSKNSLGLELGVSYSAVETAISNSYLLKEKD